MIGVGGWFLTELDMGLGCPKGCWPASGQGQGSVGPEAGVGLLEGGLGPDMASCGLQ